MDDREVKEKVIAGLIDRAAETACDREARTGAMVSAWTSDDTHKASVMCRGNDTDIIALMYTLMCSAAKQIGMQPSDLLHIYLLAENDEIFDKMEKTDRERRTVGSERKSSRMS